jgi:hypothetical protein
MDIRVKDFAVNMKLGSTGITLDVYDTDGSHLGDVRFGKATIEWCPGKTHAGNGFKIGWTKLIELMLEHGKKG